MHVFAVRLTLMSQQLFPQRLRLSMLAILWVVFLTWDTTLLYGQNGETPQPVLPFTNPDQLQYRYDTNGECRNVAGQKGTNGRLLGPCGDLTGANLKEFDLRGKDLTGALLRGTDLTSMRLEGAILKGADLTQANLADANLTGADLSGAVLAEARLLNTNLDKTNLA